MSQPLNRKSQKEDVDMSEWFPQSLGSTNTPNSCSTTSTTSILSNDINKRQCKRTISTTSIPINDRININNKIQNKRQHKSIRTRRKPLKPVTNRTKSNNIGYCSKDNYSSNMSSHNIKPPKLDALKIFRYKSNKHSAEFNANLKRLYGNKSNTYMTHNLNTLSKYYESFAPIGIGSYGQVFKARSKLTKQIVAIKQLKTFPKQPEDIEQQANELYLTVKEIMCLKNCQHPNINKLLDVVINNKSNNLCFILEYVPHVLDKVMQTLKLLNVKSPKHIKSSITPILPTSRHWFDVSHIKSIIWDCLCGLRHLKQQKIIHRDIKPSNLLITNDGKIKLCDFGLSRAVYKNNELLTNEARVVTRWYRAPEILIEQNKKKSHYGVESDMWSLGCVMAEIIIGKAIFPGKDDAHQILGIIKICGSIHANDIANVDMEHFLKNLHPTYKNIKSKLSHILMASMNASHWSKTNIEFALDLIHKMLCYDPSKRVTPTQALVH
eukprot:253140_1